MIVFAAWGPDPTSADPVTGTVEPFPPPQLWFDIKRARTINLHRQHRLQGEKLRVLLELLNQIGLAELLIQL